MERTTMPDSSYAARMPGRREANTQVLDAGAGTIAYYENDIPPFVEAEMERLYQNLFSSVAMVRAYGGTAGVSTYVAHRRGRVAAILLLRHEKSRIVVLNEQIGLDQEEIGRFVRYMFERFHSAHAVFFSAIAARVDRLGFPCHQARFTNDIVLDLPSSAPAYLASLGKSTRQNIRYSLNRIQRDCPSFVHRIYERGAEGERIFRDIVRLNRERMSEKDKVCGVDDREEQRLLALTRERGLVSVITIEGRVCAGAICFRAGDNWFLRVIAHDSRYNAYGLGLLCCYLTICECIARGGNEYHFMWGREEYKYRLLGKQRDFDALTIYRSRFFLLLDARRLLKAAAAGGIERLRLWLLDPANRDRAPARWARTAIDLVRKVRKRGA
jgi:hypothetical protein